MTFTWVRRHTLTASIHLPLGCYGECISPGTIRLLTLSCQSLTPAGLARQLMIVWLRSCERVKLGQLERSLIRHNLPACRSAQKQDKQGRNTEGGRQFVDEMIEPDRSS